MLFNTPFRVAICLGLAWGGVLAVPAMAQNATHTLQAPAHGESVLPAQGVSPINHPPQTARPEPVHVVGGGSVHPPVVAPPAGAHAKPVTHPAPVHGAPAHPAPAHPAKPGPAPALHAAPAVVVPAPAPAASATPPPAEQSEPNKGSVTGLPLPRFVALRSDDVNLRVGPDTRYPIDWVYKRRDLPVQIEREFQVWRLISDADGVKGWVHQANLTARRGFQVTGAERTMRHEADDQAAPVALLKPGVIGRIRSCAAASPWCEVQVGDYRGFLKRTDFWGVMPGEVVTP